MKPMALIVPLFAAGLFTGSPVFAETTFQNVPGASDVGTSRAAQPAAAVAAPATSTLLLTATRANNYSNASTTLIPVPLDDAGHTGMQFTTTVANQQVVIFYNAECGVIGPASSWLSVQIVILHPGTTQANPASGTNFAFCSATSTTTYNWQGVSRTSVLTIPTAGVHAIQVQAAGLNGATSWWLGDTSLVVLNGGK